MILLIGLAVIVATVVARGGDLGRLSELHLVGVRYLVAAMVIQAVAINTPSEHLPDAIAGGLHIASFALALWFVIANRTVPGVWIIALGGALNGIAVAANGGVMPASRWAIETSGVPLPDDQFTNSGAVEGARLAFLGDVFPLPGPDWIANVFSVGDVVLLVGGAVLMHRVCVARAAPAGSRRDAEPLETVRPDGVAS